MRYSLAPDNGLISHLSEASHLVIWRLTLNWQVGFLAKTHLIKWGWKFQDIWSWFVSASAAAKQGMYGDCPRVSRRKVYINTANAGGIGSCKPIFIFQPQLFTNKASKLTHCFRSIQFIARMSLVFKRFITWVGKVKPEDVRALSGDKFHDSLLAVAEQKEKEVGFRMLLSENDICLTDL